MNVCAGTITSSPAPIPAACSASASAAVRTPRDTVGDAAVVGKLSFEALDLLAEDNPLLSEDPRERCQEFLAKRFVLTLERHEPNARHSILRQGSHRDQGMYGSSGTATE